LQISNLLSDKFQKRKSQLSVCHTPCFVYTDKSLDDEMNSMTHVFHSAPGQIVGLQLVGRKTG
ncbi:hypothetical protein ACIROP_19390, partial [Bacillus velezensis]